MIYVSVNKLSGIDPSSGLGTTWRDCSKVINDAVENHVKALFGWDDDDSSLFVSELKTLREIEESECSNTEFIRCDGYSLWKVKKNDRYISIKFEQKENKIYARYCGSE